MSVAQVAAGQKITAASYNALVTEIQDENMGHAHTGDPDGGKAVSHADLTDGAIASLSESRSHAEIDGYIKAIDGDIALVDSTFIPRMLTTHYVLVFGVATTDTGTTTRTKSIDTGLKTVVGAVVTPNASYAAFQQDTQGDFRVYNYCVLGADGIIVPTFVCVDGWNSQITFHWMAWGTL